MWEKVNRQVDVSLDEAESRGACLHSYSEAAHKDLEVRRKSEKLVSPLPGLYARADYWSGLDPTQKALHKIRGLARLRPGWTFCVTSAAAVLGLSVSYRLLDTLNVAARSGGRSYCAGKVRGIYIGGEEAEGVYKDGVWITSPLRTAMDCARLLPFRDAVAIVDSALSKGLFTREKLLGFLGSDRGGVRGIAQARRVAAFADARSGSGGESIARAAMWELGFAAPELQVGFEDPVDGSEYFVDFLWRLPDGRILVGELDGGEKYANPKMTKGKSALEVMREERRRESRVTASCDAVVRFSPEDVADNWRFSQLLDAFDVPRDHEPLVAVEPPSQEPPMDEVPLEAYRV